MVCCYREKGLKIINLNPGNAQTAEGGVAAVLQNDMDDAVDPHLERIKNLQGGDESDEEVLFLFSLFHVFTKSFGEHMQKQLPLQLKM